MSALTENYSVCNSRQQFGRAKRAIGCKISNNSDFNQEYTLPRSIVRTEAYLAPDDPKKVGERLKLCRLFIFKPALTQKEMATIMGMNEDAYSVLERGGGKPNAEQVGRLVDALPGLTFGWIYRASFDSPGIDMVARVRAAEAKASEAGAGFYDFQARATFPSEVTLHYFREFCVNFPG